MHNKKQVRLRTVLASCWIEPKQSVALNSLLSTNSSKQSRKTSPVQVRSHYNSKQTRTKTEQKGASTFKVYHIFKDQPISIKCTDTDSKQNLQMFPKRQSIIKNSNPFRFFMHSTGKTNPEQGQQRVFLKKLENILQKGLTTKISTNFSLKLRPHTESCEGRARQKKKNYVQPKMSGRQGAETQKIEPWRYKQQNDFNQLHMH